MSKDTSSPSKTLAGFIALVVVTSAFSWYFLARSVGVEVKDPSSTVPPVISVAKADENAQVAKPEVVVVTAEKGVKNVTAETTPESESVHSDSTEGDKDSSADSESAKSADDSSQSKSAVAEPAPEKSQEVAKKEPATPPPAKEPAEKAQAASEKPATPVKVITAEDVNIKTKKSDSGVKYVSGGIGQDEILYMLSAFNNYSLKLTNFRGQGKRAYLSRVKVQVNNSKGDPVLTETTHGPFLFADLPAGDYQIKADYKGQSQSQKVSISGSSQKSIKLEWKDS